MGRAALFVAVGVLLGPLGFAIATPDLVQDGRAIQAVSEAVLLVVVFGAGLRLPFALDWASWRAPVWFTALTLLVTLLVLATTAGAWLGLAFPAALLLAAIVAPTDTLLVTQTALPALDDEAGARALLTAESALATILAVPLLLFALGLLGAHEVGRYGMAWVATDLLWSTGAGLAAGWCVGVAVHRSLVRARATRDPAIPEELLAVVAVASACALAMVIGASPLAAVFAGALALSHGGRSGGVTGGEPPSTRLRIFSARLERIGAAVALLLLGALVEPAALRPQVIVFALAAVAVARPLAAHVGLALSAPGPAGARVAAWIGLRGVVSVYLLSVAVNHGLDAKLAREIAAVVPLALAACIAIQALAGVPLAGRARFLRS